MFGRTTFLSAGVLALAISAQVQAESSMRYLALGDSIAFGFSPLVQPPSLDQYTGYPELVADDIHRPVTNASCFGESSGSFLTLGAPDLGCAQWRALGLPRYVNYSGTQMEYAESFLKANKKVELVTINIGGNDLG